MKHRHLTEFYLERLQPTWLTTKRSQTFYHTLFGLFFGLGGGPIGLLIGLFGGLLAGALIVQEEIRTQDILQWSWKDAQLGLLGGLLFGVFFGLRNGLLFGLLVGLLVVLVGGVWKGLSSKQINESMRIHPNQGIHSSGWNALCVGLVSGLVFGLHYGPGNGLISGVGIGQYFGGSNYFQHYLLRYLLCLSGAMHWRCVRFLGYAAERILLRKLGGGYIFIHRVLLDYFASLALPTTTNEEKDRSEQKG